jgi:pimeloyl-ACP methyl ester carboxylesterase
MDGRSAVLWALALAAIPISAPAQPASPAPPVSAETYAHPAQLVRVQGARRLNLFCLGQGTPTIILDSGVGGGAYAWYKVQSKIATFTRVCSFDRAGYGFSDPAERPSDIDNSVDDLRRLIVRAPIDGPLVLVGHSRAGFDIRLYATLYPKQVVGLVFVDPLTEGLWRALYDGYTSDQRTGMDNVNARNTALFSKCIALAKVGHLSRDKEPDCFDDVDDPVLQVEVNRQDARLQTIQAQASEIATAIPTHLQDETVDEVQMRRASRDLGALPMVVIDAEHPSVDLIAQKAHRAGLQQLATYSSLGKLVVVPSGHDVGAERPDAVVDAVRDVLSQSKLQPSSK